MSDQILYLVLLVLVTCIVVLKTGRIREKSTGIFFGAALVLAVASIGIAYVFDQSSPVSVLLLRPEVDIYSAFLISVAYGLAVRGALSFADRLRGPRS